MNADRFAEWLFRGLGRPYLYLQGRDARPYRESLLHACLYNPVYDRQCEGTRSEYLFNLIPLTGGSSVFQQQILDAFATPDDDMDFEQLFDFALLFAQAGNVHARHLMYEQFSACAGDGNDIGATQLIDLDGIEGFRFVATRLGEVVRDDPDFWDTNHLLEHLKEQTSGAVTDADITALGTSNRAVQRYLENVAATMTRRQQATQQRQILRNWPYTVLKEHISTAQQKPSSYQLGQWGQHASDDDLRAAAQDLLKQNDPLHLSSYLAIFIHRPFPLGFEPLLSLVRHNREQVARRTLQALSRFQSPVLRELGIELLQDRWHSSDALELFVQNYQPGDENIFVTLLEAAQSHDEVHALGFGMIDILAQNTVAQAYTLRSMLYERQPCSLCRTKVVQQLVSTHSISQWMRDECQFDADEATRKAVQMEL